MTVLTESIHVGEWLLSQANSFRSRDTGVVTVSGATKWLSGTVLAKLTAGATAAAAALGTNAGNGAFGAVSLVSVPTQIGVYSVDFTAATAFTVTAPNGATATGSTGVAFSALGIGFTITAGSTAFVAGDSFAITATEKVGAPTVASVAGSGDTGDGTLGSLTANGYAPMAGVYRVTVVEPTTDLGTFVVEDPTGSIIGHGVVGTAFAGGGLSFTIADGSNNFAAGDSWTVTVATGSGKYVKFDETSAVANIPAGILYNELDPVAGDITATIFTRDCEVIGDKLTGLGSTGTAGLRALGIIVR